MSTGEQGPDPRQQAGEGHPSQVRVPPLARNTLSLLMAPASKRPGQLITSRSCLPEEEEGRIPPTEDLPMEHELPALPG